MAEALGTGELRTSQVDGITYYYERSFKAGKMNEASTAAELTSGKKKLDDITAGMMRECLDTIEYSFNISKKDKRALEDGKLTTELEDKMEKAAEACCQAVKDMDKMLTKFNPTSAGSQQAKQTLQQQKKAR